MVNVYWFLPLPLKNFEWPLSVLLSSLVVRFVQNICHLHCMLQVLGSPPHQVLRVRSKDQVARAVQ